MKLSDGREIKVNLSQISVRDWRFMWRMNTDEDESDAIFGRCVGLTQDEVAGLPLRDYQRIAKAIREEASRPIDDDTKN